MTPQHHKKKKRAILYVSLGILESLEREFFLIRTVVVEICYLKVGEFTMGRSLRCLPLHTPHIPETDKRDQIHKYN